MTSLTRYLVTDRYLKVGGNADVGEIIQIIEIHTWTQTV